MFELTLRQSHGKGDAAHEPVDHVSSDASSELTDELADVPPGPSSNPLGDDDTRLHITTALQMQQRIDMTDIGRVEVSMQLLAGQAMRQLNRQYRNKDSATNVLSFESGMPVLSDEAGALLVLGDLVLCPEVIAGEAMQQGKPAEQHWAHMIVHGTLHLCGYDHIEQSEAACMENLEIRILSSRGIANPYQTQSVQ